MRLVRYFVEPAMGWDEMKEKQISSHLSIPISLHLAAACGPLFTIIFDVPGSEPKVETPYLWFIGVKTLISYNFF